MTQPLGRPTVPASPRRDRHAGGAAGPHGRPGHEPGHVVQFYEDERFLVGTVADFVADGLAGAQRAVLIATAAHRDALRAALAERGVDVARADQDGRLTWLDAHDTLAAIMDGPMPDVDRVRALLGEAVGGGAQGRGEGMPRVYGEMVDLLWAAGNAEGAVRLEELWNELAAEHDFSLLCSYPMDRFALAAHAPGFEAICRAHTQVRPTERWAEADEAQRLREVARLQQRSRALEAALEQERAARAEAVAADRAKREFLSVVSHELRTPLNAIGGYAELIELGVRGPVTDAQREDLGRIRRSQRLLLGIINEMLNYSRVESGRIAYELADVDLGEVAAAVGPLVRPQTEAKGLELRIEPGEPGLVARADREKVEQVLLNLLSNAIKFTERGGRVTISCHPGAPTAAGTGRATVLLRVRDTGIGIPAHRLESVFEPFVLVNAALTRTSQGTGLGLAISRGLARGMGGDLTVESAAGEGSVFTLALPRA